MVMGQSVLERVVDSGSQVPGASGAVIREGLMAVLSPGWWLRIEHCAADSPRLGQWRDWGRPLAGRDGIEPVLAALAACCHAHDGHAVRLVAECAATRARLVLGLRSDALPSAAPAALHATS